MEGKREREQSLECVSQASYVSLFPIYRGLVVLLFSSDLCLSAFHCLSLTISQGFCHCLSHAPSPKSESLLTQGALRGRGRDSVHQVFLLSPFSLHLLPPSSSPKLTHKQVNTHNRSKFPAVSPPGLFRRRREKNRNRQLFAVL